MLREIGTEQEEAAATLGASAFTTFRRITLPAIRWAVAYGVVLTTARSLGEFGAVSIVSGGIAGRTQTLTQYVQASYENFNQTGAYAASVLLATLAVTTLLAMTVVRAWRSRRVTSRSDSASSSPLDDVSIYGRERLAHGAARPERQRQVDAAARHRRPRSRRTSATCSSPARRRRRLAPQKRGVGFVFQHYAPFTHMTVWDNVAFGLTHPAPCRRAEIRSARRRAARARAAHRPRRPLPVAAVRWAAPAHGARACPRRRAGGAPARRAVRRARRARSQGAARVAAPPSRRDARDDDLRHARSGGGARARRQRRRHERGPRRAGRTAAPALRRARESRSS